jgi:predicted DNA-binding transcriptional regulator AlpA
MEKKFLSRQEIANVLGVSLSTVARMWKKKEPPLNSGIKLGRRVLFPVNCISAIQKTYLVVDALTEAEKPSGFVWQGEKNGQ